MNRSQIKPELSNSSISAEPPLVNPELEGGGFFWQGGADGVLLLHGLTATTAEVRPLAKRFHDEGFTVSAVLLPGHGTTPEKLSHTHRREWIAVCEKAYAELQKKCSRVIVGGESTGGILALHLATSKG